MTFPKVVRSGVTEVLLLGPAATEPKAGDHFVEDQQCTDAVALGAQALEESLRRRDHSHVRGDGLDDDRGNFVVELRHDVVRHDQRVGHCARGHAGSSGQPQCGDATSSCGQQGISGAVKVSVEDDEAVAAGEAAGQPHRRARGLGAGVHQPDHVAAGDALRHRLRQQHLARRRGAVRRPIDRCRVDCGRYRGMGMSEDDRPVALHEIDVSASLDVPHVRALGTLDDVRRAANGLEGADAGIDSTGDDFAAAFEELSVGAHCWVSANQRAR